MNLSKKLNIEIGDADNLNQEAVIFCFQNLKKRFNVEYEFIETALNDAGYYIEENDYNTNDLLDLAEIIDECGSDYERGEILDKAIWFDKK